MAQNIIDGFLLLVVMIMTLVAICNMRTNKKEDTVEIRDVRTSVPETFAESASFAFANKP